MLYPIGRYLVPPIYRLWLGKIEGMENIPTKGPFIVVLNHTSYYETLLMYTLLIPKLDIPMHALVNSRYWKNQIFRRIIEWGKCIPVYVGDEQNEPKNKKSLLVAESYLKDGHILQVFPEGSRSADGKLKKGKPGAAKLAIKTGCQVVPVGIINADKVLPKGALFPRFAKAKMFIGKPLYFGKKKKPSKKELNVATRKLMRQIASLIGQKYSY